MASVAPAPASVYTPPSVPAVDEHRETQKNSKSKICLIAAAVFVGLAVMFAVAAIFVSPVIWLAAGLCLITAIVLAIIGGSRDQSHRPTADAAPSEVYHHHLHTSASAPALTGIIVITPAQAAADPDRYYFDSVFGVYRERQVIEISGSPAACANPRGGAALTLTGPSAGSRPNLGSAATISPKNLPSGTNARAVGLADSQRAAAPASRPPPGSTTTAKGERKGNPARQRTEGT